MESPDKVGKEWFLGCNAVEQGIFGFVGTFPGFYRSVSATVV